MTISYSQLHVDLGTAYHGISSLKLTLVFLRISLCFLQCPKLLALMAKCSFVFPLWSSTDPVNKNCCHITFSEKGAILMWMVGIFGNIWKKSRSGVGKDTVLWPTLKFFLTKLTTSHADFMASKRDIQCYSLANSGVQGPTSLMGTTCRHRNGLYIIRGLPRYLDVLVKTL